MTTLFLLSSLGIGGSERKVVRIANALNHRGHDIHLAWLNTPETLRSEIAPGIPSLCLERRGKFSWAALRRLQHYVRMHGITRIICVNLYPILYARALRLLLRGAAPSCVILVNTTEFPTRRAELKMMLYAPLIRGVNEIVFGCGYQLGLWVDRYRLPDDKCRYIHNGVDSDHFSAHSLGPKDGGYRDAFGLGVEDFVVGTVGKLRPEKQQSDLIEAVAILHERGVHAFVLLAGSGEMESTLKKKAMDKGIAHKILFLGDLGDVRPLLASIDVFVLTSVSETFSNATLEAMAMSRPVVLSDVGGAREMVWESVNGQTYPVHDVERLGTILEGLAADPAAACRMGEEARRIAVEKFSFSHMVDEYERLCVE
ncbi:MAG: glycosyltransferase involved in cell wall biosynthesis [Halieaceae bacterium]|jgi:glycosyltransferase involved in cell wall biosynthesis